ncbi:unnamed protein product, partial [Linum tenue]
MLWCRLWKWTDLGEVLLSSVWLRIFNLKTRLFMEDLNYSTNLDFGKYGCICV